jgi:hypothetical protein
LTLSTRKTRKAKPLILQCLLEKTLEGIETRAVHRRFTLHNAEAEKDLQLLLAMVKELVQINRELLGK